MSCYLCWRGGEGDVLIIFYLSGVVLKYENMIREGHCFTYSVWISNVTNTNRKGRGHYSYENNMRNVWGTYLNIINMWGGGGVSCGPDKKIKYLVTGGNKETFKYGGGQCKYVRGGVVNILWALPLAKVYDDIALIDKKNIPTSHISFKLRPQRIGLNFVTCLSIRWSHTWDNLYYMYCISK